MKRIPRKPFVGFPIWTKNMACSLIFVSAKLCFTTFQLVFDSDLITPFFLLCVSVLSLQNRLLFSRFSGEHGADVEL